MRVWASQFQNLGISVCRVPYKVLLQSVRGAIILELFTIEERAFVVQRGAGGE